MKVSKLNKTIRTIIAFVAGALCAVQAMAAGVENKTNLTSGYARNPSRNVESSRPDAAFYNIGGVAFLEDGLFLELGDQIVGKKYTNEWDGIPGAVPGDEYSDTTTVFLYPDFDIVFKHNNFAVFGTFGIYAGGGTLNYDDGTSITAAAFAKSGLVDVAKEHELKVKSITYGGQIGAAFKPIEMLSVAAAIRFTYGTQSMELKSKCLATMGGEKAKYEASAFGVAPVVGVHLRPMDILDFSVQWQGCSYMNYNVDKVKGNTTVAGKLGIVEDKEFHTDIPMAFNFGAGMRVIDPLYVNVGFTYYVNKCARMDSILGKVDYDNSFEITAGADYAINEKWGVGAGLVYGNQGQKSDANSVLSPVLDSLTIGCGVEFKPIKPLTLTLSGMYSFYFDEDYGISDGNPPDATLSKKLGIIGIGATYKFF